MPPRNGCAGTCPDGRPRRQRGRQGDRVERLTGDRPSAAGDDLPVLRFLAIRMDGRLGPPPAEGHLVVTGRASLEPWTPSELRRPAHPRPGVCAECKVQLVGLCLPAALRLQGRC